MREQARGAASNRARGEALGTVSNKTRDEMRGTTSNKARDEVHGAASNKIRDEVRGAALNKTRDEMRDATSNKARDEMRGATSNKTRDEMRDAASSKERKNARSEARAASHGTPLKVWWLAAPRIHAREAAACTRADALFWLDPAREELLLGFGCARDFSAEGACGLGALARAWRAFRVEAHGAVRHGGALLLGGGPFDPARSAGGVWGDAPAARWVVPEVVFVTRAQEACCAVAGAETLDDAEALRDAAYATLRSSAPATLEAFANAQPVSGVQDLHESPAAFQRRVREAASAVARGELQKVVLARALQLQGARAFSPQDVLARLAESEPAALRYSLPLPAGRLLGATPERLLRVAGDEVLTDALAGSAARAPRPEADAAAARALLESKKDQEEHALVRRALVSALAPRLETLDAPAAPRILSTGALHHLHTPLRGTRPRANASLHPQAAEPRGAARERSQVAEPRGVTRERSQAAESRSVTHGRSQAGESRGVTREHSQTAESRGVTREHSQTAESRGVTREHSQTAESRGAAHERSQAAESRGVARECSQTAQPRARCELGVLELADLLHPTPAVAGLECATALEWLRVREPLARGAYAGPFGWVDCAGEGALAVALRCALLDGARATVFAGAGIVAASDPASEFLETELKMRALCDALRDA